MTGESFQTSERYMILMYDVSSAPSLLCTHKIIGLISIKLAVNLSFLQLRDHSSGVHQDTFGALEIEELLHGLLSND